MQTNTYNSSKIGLWRTKPLDMPLKEGESHFNLEYIFPSGRQALSYSLQHVGLYRYHRIAVPEWSSQCVVSAVGRYCMPIPITEVLRYKIKVDAVLVYEQWGWPLTKKIMNQLINYFKGAVFIQDMVDSAHFKLNNVYKHNKFKAIIQIMSLSKLLGLSSGGLAFVDGKPLSFIPESESEKLLTVLEQQNYIKEHPCGLISDLIKNSVAALPLNIKDWINRNNLFGAVESELRLRQGNLKKILNSSLIDTWPKWIIESIDNGAGPGIAPLLKGYPENILIKNKEYLQKVYGIETSIYHFNWSGNPLEPDYRKCLAFPVHGMVPDIEMILKDIEKLV